MSPSPSRPSSPSRPASPGTRRPVSAAAGGNRSARLAALLGAALGALATAAGVLWLRTPAGALEGALSSRLSALTRRPVVVRQAGPWLVGAAPGLVASGLEIRLAGEPLSFERLQLRPAWSASWLAGVPSLRAQLEGRSGSADLWLRGGPEPSVRGELSNLDLRVASLLAPALRLEGRGDGRVDLAGESRLPRGQLELRAREGSLSLPGLPLPIPFQSLALRAALGEEEGLLRIRECRLSGPALTAAVAGGIGPGPSFASAPLALQVDLHVEPALRPMLAGAGLPLSRDGEARLHIGGSAEQPWVR